ncbi:UDP-glucosyltransferase 2-like [Chrysoperla carnea]|uniref:UDP-glucosyltransferase 2-like n=1 Tax=Chrysoperla carnea TaxID=189513 RepID=UPI001D088A63|nr:UDP-glucosyltransferase 2-like [Chrysoperla carnea]
MLLLKSLTILIIFWLKSVNSANILFISPTASYSHSVVYFPIIRELSLRGHKVLTIIPDLINDPELTNLTEIDIHDEAYTTVRAHLPVIIKQMVNNDGRAIDETRWYQNYSYDATEVLFQNPDVQHLIRHPELYHFDVVITEWYTYQASTAFADLYKCPLIGISSYSLFLSGLDSIGSPTHSTYVPNSWDLYVNPRSFWDRFKSFLNAIEYRYDFKNNYYPRQVYLAKKYFGNNVTDIEEIEKRVSLVLTNTNPIIHGSYPKAANLIQFGGIHEQVYKPLPKDLEQFLDNAKAGFIYFSLGSNIKSALLGEKNINTILNVFKTLPYRVLWKFESDNLPGKPNNVFISKWVPQRAVLEHENIRLFITQGGLQSAEEAISAQVPLIIIPFFADQSQNAGRFEELGIGKRLLRTDITEITLANTINEIINNSSYKKAIIEVSNTLWDQDTDPLDRAVWWIEYVIRHKGAKYLRNPALDAPWYQVQLWDIYLFIFSIFMLLCGSVYYVNRQLYFYIQTACTKTSKFQKLKST